MGQSEDHVLYAQCLSPGRSPGPIRNLGHLELITEQGTCARTLNPSSDLQGTWKHLTSTHLKPVDLEIETRKVPSASGQQDESSVTVQDSKSHSQCPVRPESAQTFGFSSPIN